MKKLLLLALIGLCVNRGLLFAQRATRSLPRISKSVPSVSVPKITVPNVRMPSSAALSCVSAFSLPNSRNNYVPLRTQLPSVRPLKNSISSSSGSSLGYLSESSAQTPFGNWGRLAASLESFFFRQNSRGPLIRSIFRAQTNLSSQDSRFSGTVFKTVYDGKEEVFGVVAAHAISLTPEDRTLKRHFMMTFFDGEKIREFPAEIVQLSASKMLDIALVKLAPEAEKLFQPLSVSSEPVSEGDVLASQGFSGNFNIIVPERKVVQLSPVFIQTTLPVMREERPGLCGGAVVNSRQELVGIHTGSSYDPLNSGQDIGYAVNASFLNTLVEAYHNGGEVTFPFVLNGREILSLNVDEYIQFISLENAGGNELWSRFFEGKFSYRKVQQMISSYSPRYMTIVVRRTQWNPDYPQMRTTRDCPKITYRYDWETQELVTVSKGICCF